MPQSGRRRRRARRAVVVRLAGPARRDRLPAGLPVAVHLLPQRGDPRPARAGPGPVAGRPRPAGPAARPARRPGLLGRGADEAGGAGRRRARGARRPGSRSGCTPAAPTRAGWAPCCRTSTGWASTSRRPRGCTARSPASEGRRPAPTHAFESLRLVLDAGVDVQVRTTVDPTVPDRRGRRRAHRGPGGPRGPGPRAAGGPAGRHDAPSTGHALAQARRTAEVARVSSFGPSLFECSAGEGTRGCACDQPGRRSPDRRRGGRRDRRVHRRRAARRARGRSSTATAPTS